MNRNLPDPRQGGLGHAELRNVSSIEYLHEPLDVIRMRCFGQTTNKGLPITFDRYYVKVTV
ncbi:hypothetical protein P9761_11675 [Brevibacillus centrosporus]|uniref:hypothetical protein n=1 Tax=Brevibacillus centrosporus TaxID=54910 RepID=UPI002E1E860B|nr:hypothetical protein [Brevibacillus centrosporus]